MHFWPVVFWLLSTEASIFFLYSGRELFLSDSSWFVDDAEAYDKYQREEESDASEGKINILFFLPYLFCLSAWRLHGLIVVHEVSWFLINLNFNLGTHTDNDSLNLKDGIFWPVMDCNLHFEVRHLILLLCSYMWDTYRHIKLLAIVIQVGNFQLIFFTFFSCALYFVEGEIT